MAFIEDQAPKPEPYFLYLALHRPIHPYCHLSNGRVEVESIPIADFVLMIDDFIGQVEEAVAKTGEKDNTLIIFTSDNGCSPAAKIEEMIAMDHYPSYIFRGHKADIFEGGHRVPFVVRWPRVIKPNVVCHQTISTVDFFATCAAIVNQSISPNEGEDSYSLLPLFNQEEIEGDFREGTVHHSINGSFAIRKGDWKLIMCPGSGGWSFPKPNDSETIDTLPAYQLYNLKTNPGENKNEYSTRPEIVSELRTLLIKYIEDGRSTPGSAQENDPIEGEWAQIDFVK